MGASAGAAIDTMAIGGTDGRLSLPVPGRDVDDRESLHRFEFTPRIAFAQDWLEQKFENAVFGGETKIVMPKHFDELHKQYLRITLPGIIGHQDTDQTHQYPYLVDEGSCVEDEDSNCIPSQELVLGQLGYDYVDSALAAGGALIHHPFVHWVYGAGFRVVERLQYDCGEMLIDQLDFRYLHAVEELQGGSGKRHTYQAGIFQTREDLIRASLYTQEMYISLPLWYTHFIGLSKHVAMMQLTHVGFTLDVADKEDLVVCSDKNTHPYTSKPDNSDWATNIQDPMPHDRVKNAVLADKDVTVNMIYQIFYLEEAERDRLMERAKLSNEASAEEVVFTFCQRNEIQTKGVTELTHKLSGTHPIFEVIITAQLKANRDSNNWFNYSRVGPESGTAANNGTTRTHEIRITQADADIITEIGVDQNTQQRFKSMPAQHWRIVTPQVHHSNLPNKFAGHYVYVVSWGVFPEDVTLYSGSINLSRVESVDFKIKLHESVVDETVYINFYIRTFGLFAYFGNIAGAHFKG